MLLSFPRGRSGLGIIVLRITIAAVIPIVESTQLLIGLSSALSVAVMGLAIFVGVGLFTSASSALAAIFIGGLVFMSHSDVVIHLTLAAICTALTLMGGGAYSIDGLLHGQRRIKFPKS